MVAAPGRAASSMSGDAQREFVDANVLVYAFDASAGRKQQQAQRLLERLWNADTGCISVQVLQEFFVTVTAKVKEPLPIDDATSRVREFAAWRVFAPTAADVLDAIALHTQAQLAFWDAMIVLAAAESRCDVLWTEDWNDGQLLRGSGNATPSTTNDHMSPSWPNP
jgi:predicted nucleic acid-binding protein